MKIFWLPFVIVLIANIGVDCAIYRRMQHMRLLRGEWSKLHIVVAAVAHAAIIITLLQPVLNSHPSEVNMAVMMRAIWFYFMLYAPRLTWAAVHSLSLPAAVPRRLAATTRSLAVVLATVVFITMWVSYSITPHRVQVTQAMVKSARVPAEFDGYRICHISDMHLGTYNADTTFIGSCIDTINALKPDLIVFTGDLVSATADEAYPHVTQLERLKARDGVLAILGNHDYDDYTRLTPQERREDHRLLCNLITDAGWKLLTNESTGVHRGSDSIAVVGTENYSRKHHRTPNYSNLSRAMQGITTGKNRPFTLLLQHNPQMWRDEVLSKQPIDLMLSGHTHAMQCKVSCSGITLSPAALLYKEWGGLYTAGNQSLYVNTGLGMVGVPARIGATPEITIITLKR